MKWEDVELLIISSDEALVQTLGGKLAEWGAVVHCHTPGGTWSTAGRMIDVVLVDVRRAGEGLQQFQVVNGELPLAEAILINSSANISASMAGMRAGASDELTVPFDTETLKKVVSAACGRSRARRKEKRRSLLAVFGEAMSAATFAQAGEHETAIDLLRGPAAGGSRDHPATRKKDKPKS